MWTLKCYTRAGGKSEIQEFYESRDAALQAKIVSKFSSLKLSELKYWGNLGAKYAQGKGKGLLQINIKHKGLEYRFLGYISPETKDFILCDWFLKKKDSDNERAYERARDRKNDIEEGRMHIKEYDFSIETNSEPTPS